MERERLVAFYDRYVIGHLRRAFSLFSWDRRPCQGTVRALSSGAARIRAKTGAGAAQEEWMMPNLANLPIRSAIEKLVHSYVSHKDHRQRAGYESIPAGLREAQGGTGVRHPGEDPDTNEAEGASG